MSSQAVVDAVAEMIRAALPWLKVVDVTNRIPEIPVDRYGRPELFVALFASGGEVAVSVGAPAQQMWRETGAVTVAVYAPFGLGERRVREVADALRNVMRGRYVAVGSGHLHIESAAPTVNFMDEKTNHAQGSYYVAAVSLAYRFDFYTKSPETNPT